MMAMGVNSDRSINSPWDSRWLEQPRKKLFTRSSRNWGFFRWTGRIESPYESYKTNMCTKRILACRFWCCGYATVNNLPQGAKGFTTIELKTNFIGTALKDDVICIAKLVHKGRTTQVWDAEVSSDGTGKKIAIFRCTQMILWPKE